MRTRISLTAVITALICLTLSGALNSPAALGDAHTYSTTRRQVRVGILTGKALNVLTPFGVSPENPDPHVFYVAENRADLKPLGLEFVNPLAPPVITTNIYQRWANRVRANPAYDPAFDPTAAQSQVFQIGAKVTKNMGAYWEVNLDNVSTHDLQQYDVLYIHSHKRGAAFPAEQREMLRKFVDAGGTLWVENCGGFSFDNNTPFLFDINMHSGTNPSAGGVVAAPNHPLLSQPYILSPQEAQSLGDKFINDYYLFVPSNTNDNGPGVDAQNPPASGVLVPIVWNTLGFAPVNPITPSPKWRPYILAGQMGAGRVVYSSGDSGCAINDYVGGANAGYGGNSGAISGEVLAGAHPQDLKFLYNLATWSGAHSTTDTDVRRTGNTPDKIGAALIDKWSAVSSNLTARVGGPAFSKHCVFAVDGNLVMHCYDQSPGQDLDGDGNADEGIPDYIAGLPYDEIWRYDLKTVPGANAATGCSTPTIIEFYDTTTNPPIPPTMVNFPQREQVVVTLSNGTVVALRAFPRANLPGFPYLNQTVVEWYCNNVGIDFGISGATNLQIPAPAWSEGVLFVSLNTASGGRVAAIDPVHSGLNKGASAFNSSQTVDVTNGIGMVPFGPGTPASWGTPSVGYINDAASGASDKMVYVYTQRLTSGSGNRPDSIRAYPFGSRGEPLRRQGTSSVFFSRSVGAPLFPPWYIYDPANPGFGNPLLRQRVFATYKDPASPAVWTLELTYSPGLGGNGSYNVLNQVNAPTQVTVSNTIQFPNGGPTITSNDDNLVLYADYTLDWSSQVLARVTARTSLNAPDPSSVGNSIGGAPAISQDDLLYYTVDTTPSAGVNSGRGVIFAATEQGGGRTAIKWAYTMHDGLQIPLDDGSTRIIPPRLRQVNLATAAMTGTAVGDYITNVQFVGTPAIRGNVVYAVATATIGAKPVSVVCAFQANPEIKLRLGPGIDRNTPIIIRQLNPVLSRNGGAPAIVQLQRDIQYTVDYASGLVRITSLSAPNATDTFASASIPFGVKVGNTPEQLIFGTQTDVIGATTETRIVGAPGVDNLMWYAVVPATGAAPLPQLGYVSSSPSIQGDILWLGFANGYILSMDADPGATDPAAQVMGAQVKLVEDNLTTLVHARWAAKTTVSNTPVFGAPVGTGDVLAVATAEGVHAYEDTRTIVADGKRLLEVNGAGEAIWACDGTRSYGVAGGDLAQFIVDPITGIVIPANPSQSTGVAVVQKVPWARPTVARRINTSDFLVVDTGNNRIVQVDHGGNVAWEVNRLFDDFKQLTRPGDPLTLNEPTDCLYWTEFVSNLNQWFAQMGTNYTYGGLPGYVVHYLIADTGNFRIIEMVDVYDIAGRPVTPLLGANPAPFAMKRQMLFSSSSYPSQGKRYRYRALQRVLQRNGDLPATWQDPAKGAAEVVRLTLAIIQNYRLVGDPNIAQNAVNAFGDQVESGGGSLVVLSEQGKVLSVVSNLRIPNGAGGFTIQGISNPTWFSKFDEIDGATGNLVIKYLLADANGCYQLKVAVDPATNKPDPRYMDVEWVISTDDYYAMTGKKLLATCVRRLSSAVSNGPNKGLHHFLISNRFSGEDNPSVFGITYNLSNNPNNGNISGSSEFHGEVFEVDPTTFLFGQPFHNYVPDYLRSGNFLVPNDGSVHFVQNNFVATSQASIVWRTPTQTAPQPPNTFATPNFLGEIGVLNRFIGSKDRATWTSLLEQPSFADRQF
jgi:hypothetical protein